jgi:hypothetical protein
MRYQYRPLDAWTDPVTAERRSSSLFRATWNDTLVLLADEISYLDGEDPVVIQVDVTEADLRNDGMLRSRAKVGDHPGVIISFQSRFGALRYASDAYEQRWSGAMPGWQANVRAIALALEALRAVDRYGVTKRGEQYRGWTSLPAAKAGSSQWFTTRQEAAQWMARCAGESGITVGPAAVADAPLYKALAKRMHPDVDGGSKDLWERLDAAATLLGLRENKNA